MKHVFCVSFGCLLGLLLLLGPVSRAQAPAWSMAISTSQPSATISVVNATAADAQGNIFIAGSLDGTASFGNITLNSMGDAFVAKWSPTTGFLWVQQGMGGSYATSLVVSGSNVYVGGFIVGPIVRFGGVILTKFGGSSGGCDAFVAKLTDAGSTGSFVWAQRVGALGYDTVDALAVHGNEVFAAGRYAGTVSFGATTLVSSKDSEVFVAKLSDAGASGSFVWAQRTGAEEANALAVNGSNVYLVGTFQLTADFGAIKLTSAGGIDVFVAKFTDAGSTSSFSWAKQAGGPGQDMAGGLATSGINVYLAGSFGYVPAAPFVSPITPASFDNITLVNIGFDNSDVFLAKLIDAGSSAAFAWAEQAGGSGYDKANALAVVGNSVYMTGSIATVGTAAFGTTALAGAGSSDIFVAKLQEVGASRSFAWAVRAGGNAPDAPHGITVSGDRVYVAGLLSSVSADFGNFTLLGNSKQFHAFLASVTDASLLLAVSSSAHAVAQFTLFPNPAHTAAIVQLPAISGAPTATLTLLDALGRTLRTQTAFPNARAELDLTGLAPGLYAVRVAAGAATATQRLVVE